MYPLVEGTYLGWGVPTLAWGTYHSQGEAPTFTWGSYPSKGYLAWLRGTYLGWRGIYTGHGVPFLVGAVPTLTGRYLPKLGGKGTYPGKGNVPSLVI